MNEAHLSANRERWTAARFAINVRGSEVRVRGVIRGPFGIREEVGGVHSLTHLPSGLRILSGKKDFVFGAADRLVERDVAETWWCSSPSDLAESEVNFVRLIVLEEEKKSVRESFSDPSSRARHDSSSRDAVGDRRERESDDSVLSDPIGDCPACSMAYRTRRNVEGNLYEMICPCGNTWQATFG